MRALGVGLLLLLLSSSASLAQSAMGDFPDIFQMEVKSPLSLSASEIDGYRARMAQAFLTRDLVPGVQFVVLVDRSPQAQRALVFIGGGSDALYVGATKVSTGDIGRFDYYITPLGVFEHTLLTDFRAQGTTNAHGVRGYGAKGMRIWDFGWQQATKGWGARFKTGELGAIRLQMHATDPELLEPRLGRRASKGCVRIPASLNKFLDEYGVLDGYYDVEVAKGHRPWVWDADHVQTPYSGRYLVVVDTSVDP
jgi:hypothetical protein